MISDTQIRNARVLLGWTVRELARRAELTVFTISQIESTERANGYPGLSVIKAILEAKGIVFAEEEGPGVRLVPKRRS
jgi:transcriptional regulator with XRE-family HTH domain